MALINLPKPASKQKLSDLQLFAKVYFNIELTDWMMKHIYALSTGRKVRGGTAMEVATATNILKTYVAEGLKKDGRQRLPKTPIPVIDNKKMRHLSQHSKILTLIKRPGGAYNFELSRFALKYTSVISDLRKDGHNIIAIRQYLKNGRASNTWLYVLGGE